MKGYLYDKVFVDVPIDLTGLTVEHCVFDGCIVTLLDDPRLPTTISDCEFRHCLLRGAWPTSMIEWRMR